ncbi:hypothetical protein D9615_010657 [Tricholomella constricta]|uniref:Uncharacterized protein n=1 Tax=Tricholomella constricta TaxID=117010 RepID=A0A8H5GJF2_9AGAR|nr:hypothetical protein D9615_010657 [Tricholomella constricta]
MSGDHKGLTLYECQSAIDGPVVGVYEAAVQQDCHYELVETLLGKGRFYCVEFKVRKEHTRGTADSEADVAIGGCTISNNDQHVTRGALTEGAAHLGPYSSLYRDAFSLCPDSNSATTLLKLRRAAHINTIPTHRVLPPYALTDLSDIRRKLVIVGDGACDKTCLLIVFWKGTFPEVYVSTAFENYVADVEVDGSSSSLPHGIQQVKKTTTASDPSDSHSSSSALLTTPPTPLTTSRRSHALLRRPADHPRRDMSVAQKISAKHYLECSAKSGEGVREVFQYAALLSRAKKGGLMDCGVRLRLPAGRFGLSSMVLQRGSGRHCWRIGAVGRGVGVCKARVMADGGGNGVKTTASARDGRQFRMCLALDRPPAMYLSYVDCEFPVDEEANTREIQNGFLPRSPAAPAAARAYNRLLDWVNYDDGNFEQWR